MLGNEVFVQAWRTVRSSAQVMLDRWADKRENHLRLLREGENAGLARGCRCRCFLDLQKEAASQRDDEE